MSAQIKTWRPATQPDLLFTESWTDTEDEQPPECIMVMQGEEVYDWQRSSNMLGIKTLQEFYLKIRREAQDVNLVAIPLILEQCADLIPLGLEVTLRTQEIGQPSILIVPGITQSRAEELTALLPPTVVIQAG